MHTILSGERICMYVCMYRSVSHALAYCIMMCYLHQQSCWQYLTTQSTIVALRNKMSFGKDLLGRAAKAVGHFNFVVLKT